MPTIKAAYCHCQVSALVLLENLPKLNQGIPNCEYLFIGKDHDANDLSFDILRRWSKTGKMYDYSRKQFVERELPQEKLFTFTLRDNIVELPSTRAIKQFAEVMRHIGLGSIGLYGVAIDLLNWLKGALMLHSSSQLKNLTLHGWSAGEILYGKFDAKSLDNRIHLDFIQQHVKQLTAVKIGWFQDGMKYGLAVGNNSKMECTCPDLDALIHFFDTERQTMLNYALPCPVQTELTDFAPIKDENE
jgi:hypothetical protein